MLRLAGCSSLAPPPAIDPRIGASCSPIHTVPIVLVLLATAEPFGAYHLAPVFAHAAPPAGVSFVHLLPYPETVQGTAAVRSLAEFSLLARADRLVLCGGGFSPWLELLAHHASSIGLPLYYTQLARHKNDIPQGLPIRRATVWTEVEAEFFATVFTDAEIRVVGNPILDEPSIPTPRVPGSLLVLSTADPAKFDPALRLPKIAAALAAEGCKVQVRLHPRETGSVWEGVECVRDGSFAAQVDAADLVVAYDGSLPLLAAARSARVCCFSDPENPHPDPLPLLHRVHDTASARAALYNLPTLAPESLIDAVGPFPGAARRIMHTWCAQ